MIPQNGTSNYAYMRRKKNKLGDDLDDFEKPILFSGIKKSVSKKAVNVGGLYFSNSSTYFESYNLPLTQDEMKKDDVIVQVDDQTNFILKGRLWRVDSVNIEFDKLRIMPKNGDEAEKKAPKRIFIQ